jgi:hypothetical protein
MTELSPAAQAVLDATGATGTFLELTARGIAAAALYVVADQVVPPSLPTKSTKERTLYIEGYKDSGLKVRKELLAIATELEGQP